MYVARMQRAHLYLCVTKRGCRPIYDKFNLHQFHSTAGIIHEHRYIALDALDRNTTDPRGGGTRVSIVVHFIIVIQ